MKFEAVEDFASPRVENPVFDCFVVVDFCIAHERNGLEEGIYRVFD